MFSATIHRKALSALVLYFLLWSVLPLLLSGSYPLDVSEGIYWGREWQWGYYKHPPLSSWVLFSFYHLFGHVGPYLLSQLCIALSMWLVYRLGCQLTDRPRALLASFLLPGIFYYTLPSLEFNHNVAQMPVWIGLAYLFQLSLNRGHWRDWIGLGLLAGAGLLVKYSVAVLLVVMVLYTLATPQRRLWLGAKPWVALLLAALVFLPNLIWLVQHDWLPFVYAEGRADEAEQGGGRLGALKFLLTQVLNHLPLLLIVLASRSWPRWPRRPLPEPLRFALVIGWAPALLLVLVGLVFGFGLRDLWGMPMWGLSSLIVVMLIPSELLSRNRARLLRGVAVWLALITVLMVVKVEFGGRLTHRPSRMDWPQLALAQQAQQQWQALSSCPMNNISGDGWLADTAAAYLPGSVSVMIAGDPAYSPWMTPPRLLAHGSLAIWPQGGEPELPLLAPLASSEQLVVSTGQWSLAWDKVPGREPLVVQWRAYVPRACARAVAQP